ncbi:MAG: NAD(P)H-dependent oxidoreductase [Planctomycetota bacterium]
MQIAVICCSLNPDSRSTGMAENLRDPLAEAGARIDWIDLRDHDLPICDGTTVYGRSDVQAMTARIADADGVILAMPIYNYDGNAAAKNLIELTGKGAWLNKTVGFVCSAGSPVSYMSVMPLANSLMLDFRCLILPRFVYADDRDFDSNGMSEKIADRLNELARETVRITAALADAVAAE